MKKTLLFIAVAAVTIYVVFCIFQANREQGTNNNEPINKQVGNIKDTVKPFEQKISKGGGAEPSLWFGKIDDPVILFPANHLPSGENIRDQKIFGDTLWQNSACLPGDTVTINIPWGYHAIGIVDSIQFQYDDYYDHAGYYFIAHTIEKLSSLPYYTTASICVVLKGSYKTRYGSLLDNKKEYSSQDTIQIEKWLTANYRHLADKFNASISNKQDKFNVLIPKESILAHVKSIYTFKDATGEKHFLVSAKWMRDKSDSPFGLYAVGTTDNSIFTPSYSQEWSKPYGEEGYVGEAEAVIITDTTGGIGLIVDEQYWEGRAVKLKVLSRDLSRVLSEETQNSY